MAIPYELTGRRNQKARTRTALVDAARELPSRDDADRRGGGRGRCRLPHHRVPLLPEPARARRRRPPPDRPGLAAARRPAGGPCRASGPRTARHESDRARLGDTAACVATALPRARRRPYRPGVASGPAIGWLTDALEPLAVSHPDLDLRRLAVAIRAATGIEAFVWLVDVAGLPARGRAGADARQRPRHPAGRDQRRRPLSAAAPPQRSGTAVPAAATRNVEGVAMSFP